MGYIPFMKSSKPNYLSESEAAIAARLIAQQRRRRQEQAQAELVTTSKSDASGGEAGPPMSISTETETGEWLSVQPPSLGPLEHRLFRNEDLRRALTQASVADTRGALQELRALGSIRRLAAVPPNYADRCRELGEEFPQFSEVLSEKIMPELAIGHFGGQGIKFPHLCLQGAPGVGKTFFANRLAEAFGLPFTRINLEGAQGGFCITGLDRSYSNHAPGEIVRYLIRGNNVAVINGIIAMEEVDKAAGDSRYSVENSLIQILEETTARDFCDLSIPELKFDITPVNFIFTANTFEGVSAPVLSRMQKIALPELTADQLTKIATTQFNKLIKQLNLQAANLVLPVESLTALNNVSPREQKRLLRSAIGIAIHQRQVEVKIGMEQKTPNRKTIGFI